MSEVPQAEQALLAGAVRRIGSLILWLVPIGSAAAAWYGGGALAGAFAFGGLLAYLNYRWVVAVVDVLVQAQRRGVPRRAYLKLFLPLALLAGVLYAIFSLSMLSGAGVLAGLSLLVIAVMLEGVYQIILGVRG